MKTRGWQRTVRVAVIAMVAVVSLIAIGFAQGRPAPSGQAGRFVIATPPIAAASAPSFNNFVSVLDVADQATGPK